MSNKVAWLFPYWKNSFEHYYAELSLPQGTDACLYYQLSIKQRDGIPLSGDEEVQWKSMSSLNYSFNKAWETGSYIAPNAMPTKMFKKPILDLPKELPTTNEIAFSITGGYLIISQDFYNVLSKARLGKTHFSQVQFYDIITQELLTNTPYYFINIAEQREWVDTSISKNISKNPHNPSLPTFYLNSVQNDDIKLVSQARTSEVDIWCDPQFNQSFFMSEKLVHQLIKAGISHEQLGLIACDIIQN